MKRQNYRDPTLSAMTRAEVPLTRENYIEWMSLGELNGDEELDPELEELLPAHLRRDALEELLTDKVQ